MKAHFLFILLLLMIGFSSCEEADNEFDVLPRSLQETDFFDFEQNRGEFSHPNRPSNAHFTVDPAVLKNSEKARERIARQIVKVAKDRFSAEQVDELLLAYGQPVWDVGIICPTCTDATMYFPFLQGENTTGLLAVIDRDGETEFQIIPSRLVEQGSRSDNWVRAYSHFESERGVFDRLKSGSLEKTECYAAVAQSIGSCWLTYAIIHCVAQDFSMTCNNGGGSSGGGSSSPGGSPPPIDSGSNGGGSGSSSYVSWNGTAGSDGSIAITDLEFNINWKPSPEQFEEKLNCPPGSFHGKGSSGYHIKRDILRNHDRPCKNPDVHLDPDDNIILVCRDIRYRRNTGESIYAYSCE